ncbi:shugoshin 1 [Bombina bombina]|uniref:shugoshin 1 n=1 Tax=Bombina bombina TaxID=8345 RepID=UPI00235B2AB0|nr:shugoshin 1 [Bombina bombina]
MAKERCVKKSFQDSLEDIKERMKEKRTKKLAKVKVASANKALCSKVKMLSNTSVTAKNFQANNKALALALEAEKAKTRQAQDLILHLKREHQRLMFEIFLLRRKLTVQQGKESAEFKLASLKEIISKVTHNLLETANLLGPAHALCSSDKSNINTPGLTSSDSIPNGLMDIPQPASVSEANKTCLDTLSNSNTYKRNPQDSIPETIDNISEGKKLPKGRRSGFASATEENVKNSSNFLRNVSVRRRHSSLNIYREEPVLIEPVEDHLHSGFSVCEQKNQVNGEHAYKDSTEERIENVQLFENPLHEDLPAFENMSEIASSTPEPKPKLISNKQKDEPTVGKERSRKGKTDGGHVVHLKKPWENARPRARSKSRERGASKHAKEKIDASLNNGDAYDFVFEESVHVTPFRQNKQEDSPQKSSSGESSSEEELDDSLYVPYRQKSKAENVSLRPRSKRGVAPHNLPSERKKNDRSQQGNGRNISKNEIKMKSESVLEMSRTSMKDCLEIEETSIPACKKETNKNITLNETTVKTENGNLYPTEKNTGDPAPPSPRLSLSDVTNLSGSSAIIDSRKLSYPFFNGNECRTSGTPIRKRRCTVTVNYAEPKLCSKLRRGDPFTDTEFLHSPIFKQKDAKRKSFKRQSLAKYNEAFVGCR